MYLCIVKKYLFFMNTVNIYHLTVYFFLGVCSTNALITDAVKNSTLNICVYHVNVH